MHTIFDNIYFILERNGFNPESDVNFIVNLVTKINLDLVDEEAKLVILIDTKDLFDEFYFKQVHPKSVDFKTFIRKALIIEDMLKERYRLLRVRDTDMVNIDHIKRQIVNIKEGLPFTSYYLSKIHIEIYKQLSNA